MMTDNLRVKDDFASQPLTLDNLPNLRWTYAVLRAPGDVRFVTFCHTMTDSVIVDGKLNLTFTCFDKAPPSRLVGTLMLKCKHKTGPAIMVDIRNVSLDVSVLREHPWGREYLAVGDMLPDLTAQPGFELGRIAEFTKFMIPRETAQAFARRAIETVRDELLDADRFIERMGIPVDEEMRRRITDTLATARQEFVASIQSGAAA